MPLSVADLTLEACKSNEERGRENGKKRGEKGENCQKQQFTKRLNRIHFTTLSLRYLATFQTDCT